MDSINTIRIVAGVVFAVLLIVLIQIRRSKKA